MLRALIIVASLSMPLIAPSAAAGADFETLHRAASEPSGWQSIGPAPPTISATVAADPKSHTIYIGSVGGGVIKSTDGGITVRSANNGLAGLTITGLAMSPTNPNVVYVNTHFEGFYKTVEGESYWTGGDWGGMYLGMDIDNPNVVSDAAV